MDYGGYSTWRPSKKRIVLEVCLACSSLWVTITMDIVTEDGNLIRTYNLPVGGHVVVENGQAVKAGDIIGAQTNKRIFLIVFISIWLKNNAVSNEI